MVDLIGLTCFDCLEYYNLGLTCTHFLAWVDVLYFDCLASPVLINQKITLVSISQHFELKPLEPRPSSSFSAHNIFSGTVIWLPLIPQVTDSFS